MKRLFGLRLSSALLLSIALCTSLGIAFTNVLQVYADTPALFLNVPTATVQEGDRVTVDVLVRSSSQSINAVSGTIVFPENTVRVVGISKEKSIIDLWTRDPSVQRGKVVFEGIMLNPGFQGDRGSIFHITFEAKTTGTATIRFSDGAVLANDGLGSNIASTLAGGSFKIASGIVPPSSVATSSPISPVTGKIVALPVITDYSASVDPEGAAFIKGKGEPNALTKIEFKNTSFKSIGEQFISFLQTKKRTLDAVIVKNDASGAFEYTTPSNIIAGAYNATPYLVDTKTDAEKPGLGVQLFVADSPIVRILVVIINILALLIPVVGLGVVIYFIPWYSFKRMRVLGRRFGLEEEKLKFSTRAFAPEPAPAPHPAPDPSAVQTPPSSPPPPPIPPTPPMPQPHSPVVANPESLPAVPAAPVVTPSQQLPNPPYAYMPQPVAQQRS